jgi:hypothetical protein
MKPVPALIFAFLLAGCSTLKQESRTPFVGNWLYVDDVQSCRYSFNADGSFSGEVTHHKAPISRFTGRWRVEEKALIYTYLSDAFGRIPAGATDRDQVLQVSGDSFVIQAANGERRRYRRVR